MNGRIASIIGEPKNMALLDVFRALIHFLRTLSVNCALSLNLYQFLQSPMRLLLVPSHCLESGFLANIYFEQRLWRICCPLLVFGELISKRVVVETGMLGCRGLGAGNRFYGLLSYLPERSIWRHADLSWRLPIASALRYIIVNHLSVWFDDKVLAKASTVCGPNYGTTIIPSFSKRKEVDNPSETSTDMGK